MIAARKQALLFALTAGVSSIGLTASTAQAQAQAQVPVTTTADEGSATNDIIVTATRRAQSLQDVAMSVDVATGDELQKLNIFDTKDISQLSPGLDLTNTTGRNNTTTLRGITFDPDSGTAPAVQVYFNEIPTDAQTVYTALYDIGQIEVLRGPQGLLRGLSSPAGAITVTTRRPNFDEIEGYVQGTGTNRSGYNVQGGVSLPFSDTFSIRASALVDGNRLNNVVDVNRNGERSRSRTESGRITLGWKPAPEFTAFLTYQHLNADNRQEQQVFGTGNAPSALFGDPTRTGPALGVKDYKGVAEGISRFQNRSDIVNLNLDYDLGPATLSFVGAHQNTLLTIDRDLDNANAVPNYVANQHVESPYIVNTGELRLTSTGDGMFGWGLGAFYARQTGTSQVVQRSDQFVAGALPVAFGIFLPIETRVAVPVFQSTVSFNANGRAKVGKLTLEGGLRYSILTNVQTADVRNISPGNPAIGVAAFDFTSPGVPAALARTRNKPLTGGLTLTYEPTSTLTAYAAYGRAFRAGSTGVSVPLGVTNDIIQSKPEKTDSFEVGVKSALLDRRLNVSFAAFYQKIDNYLSRFNSIYYNCTDGGAAFANTCINGGPPINNATDTPRTNGAFDFNYNGDATVKGVEGTIEGRPVDNWDVSVSASYAKARFKNALLPCNDFNGDGIPDATGTPVVTGTGSISYCKSNGRLSDTPDFALTANSEIRFPIGDLTPFVRGLVSYRPSFTSERADFNYQSRTLLNLYVGLRGLDSRWELNVFAKNVLNQQRITNISQGEVQYQSFASGYRAINTTNPREFGVTSTFKF